MRHISPILRFVLVSLVFSVGNSAFVNAQQSTSEHATIIRTAKLNENLRKIYDGMPEEYQPRTEHFLATGEPTYVNRLISKNSPYLLQHAHNPVDWRAWGPEALLEAKQADLPIFLSIGYSTCHWCHVMERESFENVDIANILNVNYIPIKVDREQRPDIDQIYMTAAQLENGRGGWPLSALLLPDGKPFFTGTYFPPENFQHILLQGSQVWHQQNLQVKLHASDLSRAISSYLNVIEEATELNAEVLQASIQSVLLSHEELEGGFSEAPKFPNEPIQSLLMQIARDGGPLAGEALQAVEHTLDAIQRGGINDQLGGGFHRYSTDNSWLVPHFEKMLYNQAQLGKLYVEAYELTGRADFKRTAKRTFDYILHEMTSPLGTFYSATDADNLSVHGEMEEGDFFVWSVQELKMLLNEEDFARAQSIFDLSEGGNFEGRNILALDTDVGPEDLKFIDRISPTLLAHRGKRNPPLRDDKVIVAWNGQLIEALATAALVFDEVDYAAAAIKAAESLFETNWNAKSGDLQRIQFQGKADELAAQLDDYAALTLASIRLYDLTFDERWYARAGALLSTMQTKFRDEDSSFFMTASLNGADGQLDLITRPKEYYDGAQPSSNSLALAALVEYYQRNGQPMLKREALETWTRLSGNALKSTGSHPIALLYGIKLNSESASSTRFAANGTVKLKVNRSANKLTVIAETKEGWHMNSSEPLQEDYIPTTLAGPDLSKITYPVASMYKPDFSDELLSVYDGATMFTSAINSNAASTATLQIQVCSNQICLPPENVSLFIPATPQ